MSGGSEDQVWEANLQEDPHQLRTWIGYLKVKAEAPLVKRCLIYERALRYLGRSYKLWAAYLEERTSYLQTRSIADKRYETLVETYERALVHMGKMPRIWINYCKLMMKLKRGTATRKVFDRALRSLPVSQHEELWGLYVDWAKTFGVAETGKIVMRRYLFFEPEFRENYIEWCMEQGEIVEAMQHLKTLHDAEDFMSTKRRTKLTTFLELCELCAGNPGEVTEAGLDMESLVREGISAYADQAGKLWCHLANFNVRQGYFDKAREVFEEAVNTVLSVKDFSVVFDALVKVEEGTLVALMESGVAHDSPEMEDRMQHIERMLERRPLLLSNVLLRQNPNNVHEWLKRVELIEAQASKEGAVVLAEGERPEQTYLDALEAVDPAEANGRVSRLWSGLAGCYEKSDNLKKCRETWKKASEVQFRSADETAIVSCGWAEMEIRKEQYPDALQIMRGAISPKGKEGIAAAACNNAKVWALYLDLIESLGTADEVRGAYDDAMKRKAATAQMCLNYAEYLEEATFFEESFRVFERSVDLFVYPQVKQIWVTYIEKFTARYGGSKLERLRDLYEQAVKGVPTGPDAVELYLHYGKAEEKYGLPRHVIAVYDRATGAVPQDHKLDMYRLYVKKICDNLEPAKARPAYERAIKELDDEDACKLCVDYASLERDLSELERARAIFAHGSQFANPSVSPEYWSAWRQFEEAHGNEDTFREMLRRQRSVEASYSHVRTDLVDMVKDSNQAKEEEGQKGNVKRKFVSASSGDGDADEPVDDVEQSKRSRKNGDDNEEEIGNVSAQSVPSSVFGGLEKI